MSNKSDWKKFKNYLHNDLKVTKSDIREWVFDAVTVEATKIIHASFRKYPVTKETIYSIVRKKAEESLYSAKYIHTIEELIAKELAAKIKVISLEEVSK